MSGYTVFAKYYDELTENISYAGRAGYFDRIIKNSGVGGKKLLDLACGTGSLSFELSRLGYDVIGAEASAEMLAIAACKNMTADKPVFFINQPMEKLELMSEVDVIVCALDSINHISNPKRLALAFERAADCLSPDGLFIFDVNSEYKHFNLLSGKTYIYDCKGVYCVWQNGESKDNDIKIELDFFERGSGQNVYNRSSESFYERYYPRDELQQTLAGAGLQIVAVYADDSLNPPSEFTQRLIYTVKKRAR